MIKYTRLFKLAFICSLIISLQAEYIRDDNKKIVLDSSNGLMWQDDAVGNTMNWTTALTSCENLTLGGFSDWRLPNQNELYSLADRSRSNPALSPAFVNYTFGIDTNYNLKVYWSSTSYIGNSLSNSDYAWGMYYHGEGSQYWGNKATSNYVRCVRGGQ